MTREQAWVNGLSFAVIAGGLFVPLIHALITKAAKLPDKDDGLPSWIVGLVERITFCVLVGISAQGVATAMIGWLGLKIAANWGHKSNEETPLVRTRAFCAITTGMVSLLFAAIGGVIAGGKL
ncbi:MAG: hypothetical protein AB7P08_12830 [Burkholderiales bacterium]